nr:hypothetical protein [uncultured Allomuricauda sp.]
MKTKRFFLLLSILVCFTMVQCKTTSLKKEKSKDYRKYWLEIYKADSLALIGKYENSFNILDSLFKIYEPTNTPPYYEYETYLKVGHLSKKDISKTKVKSLIDNYGFDIETFDVKTYPVLNKVFEESNISKKSYHKHRKKYLDKIDTILREKVLKLKHLDQEARRNTSEKTRIKLMDSIDLEVEKFLIDIFSRNIFPNEHIIGNHTIDKNPAISIDVLLLHTRDSIRLNYFIPRINSFVEEGKCLPSIYCKMIDQYQLYNDKEQIYGTYNFNELKAKEYNFIRKKAGLPSLEYLQWKYKKILEGF